MADQAESLFLKKIIMKKCELGKSGARRVSQILGSAKALHSLILTNNNFGPEGAQEIAKGLCSNTTLLLLDLGHNSIDEKAARKLCDAFRNEGPPL